MSLPRRPPNYFYRGASAIQKSRNSLLVLIISPDTSNDNIKLTSLWFLYEFLYLGFFILTPNFYFWLLPKFLLLHVACNYSASLLLFSPLSFSFLVVFFFVFSFYFLLLVFNFWSMNSIFYILRKSLILVVQLIF